MNDHLEEEEGDFPATYPLWYRHYRDTLNHELPYPYPAPASLAHIPPVELAVHLQSLADTVAALDEEEICEQGSLVRWEVELAWFEHHEIPRSALLCESQTCQLPPNWRQVSSATPLPCTRKEAERWVAAYTREWQAYDDLEAMRTFKHLSRKARDTMRDAINRRFCSAATWLRDHGISEQSLCYDRLTKTYSLPADSVPKEHLPEEAQSC